MNIYKKRAEETIKKLDTNEIDWSACSIQSFKLVKNENTGKHNWIPEFLIPNGYVHVETDYPFDKKRQCELCSHDIIYFYALKHDNNKWYMFTGSTCITHFDIKEFVKKEFNEWKNENLAKEWKEIFVPYAKKAIDILTKHNLYLPIEIASKSEWVKFLNSKNEKLARQAKAMEEYGWLIDINDDIDENSTKEQIEDAYKKNAPGNIYQRYIKLKTNKKSLISFKVKKAV